MQIAELAQKAGFMRSLKVWKFFLSFSSLEKSGKKFVLVCWHGKTKFLKVDIISLILC